MRKDMSKVIVERPRKGGNKSNLKRTRRSYKSNPDQDSPTKESMKQAHKEPRGWDDLKELNENLAPLHRFLQKNAGRKWDDVYSEICEHININSDVQYHILQHIEWDVQKNIVIRNKIPYTTRWGNEVEVFGSYIDPKGYLRYRQYISHKWNNREKKILWLDEKKLTCFYKHKDIWYILTLKNVFYGPDRVYDPLARKYVTKDVLKANTCCVNKTRNIEKIVFPKKYFAIAKKQCGKKDLKILKKMYDVE